MRFIYSLALAQLFYVVVISQELRLDEFNSCEIGLWQCGLGQQCVACYEKATGNRINLYCNDPTNGMLQSLCGLVTRTVRCDDCGAKNDGRDEKTGLEYINNGDACQKDADCGNGGLCASCKFEAFSSNIPDWFNFCNNPSDPKRQYCNPKRHKGACVCGDKERKSQQFIVPESSMLDLDGQQEQNGFAQVSEEQAVLPLINDFEVADNGFADNGYPPHVGQAGKSQQFDDWSVENFLIN